MRPRLPTMATLLIAAILAALVSSLVAPAAQAGPRGREPQPRNERPLETETEQLEDDAASGADNAARPGDADERDGDAGDSNERTRRPDDRYRSEEDDYGDDTADAPSGPVDDDKELYTPVQQIKDVNSETTGTTATIEFASDVAVKKAWVMLNGGLGSFAFKPLTPTTPTKLWTVEIQNLRPGTSHALAIGVAQADANEPFVVHVASSVVTKTRTVKFNVDKAAIIDDSDPLGCGEFAFQISAVGLVSHYVVNSKYFGALQQNEGCSGEDFKVWPDFYAWLYLTVQTQNDIVSLSGFAVDDDTVGWTGFMSGCDVGFATQQCKDWGEWSLGSKNIDVGPTGPNNVEDYAKPFSVHVNQGPDDVDVVLHGTYEVSHK